MRKLSQITTAIALFAIVSGCSAKSESSIAPSPVASPVPVASASPNPFGLPKASCGDPAVGGDEKWFGVFIDGGDVQEVRKKYCGDAIAMTRQTTGKPSIQVASFNDRARAVAFAAAVGGEASDYDPSSVNETANQPVSPSPSTETNEPHQPLALNAFHWHSEDDYVRYEGQVTNTTDEPIKSLQVVVEFYDADGQFISSDESFMKYNPVMPGQSTPFSGITTHNPLMKSTKLSFKTLRGGQLGIADVRKK